MSSAFSSSINVYPAAALDDINRLRPVLESAIRDSKTGEIISNEVESNLAAVIESATGNSDRYFDIAADSGGIVLGMMGLQIPTEAMRSFATTDRPIELINAFVHISARGRGVGRLLLRSLEDKARQDGHTETLVNSGPRYMYTGWPFWDAVYGKHVGQIDDYFEPGVDARVWRHSLD